jgi:hypothetical protein
MAAPDHAKDYPEILLAPEGASTHAVSAFNQCELGAPPCSSRISAAIRPLGPGP